MLQETNSFLLGLTHLNWSLIWVFKHKYDRNTHLLLGQRHGQNHEGVEGDGHLAAHRAHKLRLVLPLKEIYEERVVSLLVDCPRFVCDDLVWTAIRVNGLRVGLVTNSIQILQNKKIQGLGCEDREACFYSVKLLTA